MTPIESFTGEHEFLSNFFMWGFTFKNVISYPSAEHAFQVAKTYNMNEQRYIMGARTPAGAKRRGRRVTLREGWDTVKNHWMLQILRAKFADDHLRMLLVQTAGRELIFGNNHHETYWGKCYCSKHNKKGENHLGILLMQVREEILSGEK